MDKMDGILNHKLKSHPDLNLSNNAYVSSKQFKTEVILKLVRFSPPSDPKHFVKVLCRPDPRVENNDIQLCPMLRLILSTATGDKISYQKVTSPAMGITNITVEAIVNGRQIIIKNPNVEKVFVYKDSNIYFEKSICKVIDIIGEGIYFSENNQIILSNTANTPNTPNISNTQNKSNSLNESTSWLDTGNNNNKNQQIGSRSIDRRENRYTATPLSELKPEGSDEINIDFTKMGIGGCKDKIDQMIKQGGILSRIMDDDTQKKLHIKHGKGILLHGPPGTGKTLIARQIANIIRGSIVKFVNGPELSSKFVGETEANMREIFNVTDNPDKLHIIIMDEIDAIGRKRGTGSTHDDKALTQLLTLIDGLNETNNLLVIGITNRKDVLDSALIRSGRLECHIEIPLPTVAGRKDIFDIYLNPLRVQNMLDNCIKSEEFALKTDSYSGSDISSLVNMAKNFALVRSCNIENNMIKQSKDKKEIKVMLQDLEEAYDKFRPTFSKYDKTVKLFIMHNGFDSLPKKQGKFIVEQIEYIKMALETQLKVPLIINIPKDILPTLVQIEDIDGVASNEERIIASHIASLSGLPFIKYVSFNSFLGKNGSICCDMIDNSYEECMQADKAVLILDSIGAHRSHDLNLKIKYFMLNPLELGKQMVIINL